MEQRPLFVRLTKGAVLCSPWSIAYFVAQYPNRPLTAGERQADRERPLMRQVAHDGNRTPAWHDEDERGHDPRHGTEIECAQAEDDDAQRTGHHERQRVALHSKREHRNSRHQKPPEALKAKGQRLPRYDAQAQRP